MSNGYSLLDKLTSGRRWLAYVAGLVLLAFGIAITFALTTIVLNPCAEMKELLVIYVALFGQIITLIGMVYKDYFNKARNESNGNQPTPPPVP